VGQPVVARVASAPADDLDDDGEDGAAQDEGGEVQVQLGDGPHGQTGADEREGPVGGLAGGLLRADGQRGEHGEEGGEGEEGDEDEADRLVPPITCHCRDTFRSNGLMCQAEMGLARFDTPHARR
jgi:hypothetical protein